jgi:hypothetical protein
LRTQHMTARSGNGISASISICDHVGATAVYPEKKQMRDISMGTDATSTAYAAELQGIQLAAAMAKAEVDACACQKLTNVFADNQAAIRPAHHWIKFDHLHRTFTCLHLGSNSCISTFQCLNKTKLLHTASSICCGPL